MSAVAFVDAGHELGTTYHALVHAPAAAEPRARRALAEAREVVRALEASLSEWRESSHISAVNRDGFGREVALEPALRHVLGGALHVAAVTGGAFDVTWRTLAVVWEQAVIGGVMPS
ncbi:MAG: FAD:protein FMN transferase, partial [Myxococcota bacterium]